MLGIERLAQIASPIFLHILYFKKIIKSLLLPSLSSPPLSLFSLSPPLSLSPSLPPSFSLLLSPPLSLSPSLSLPLSPLSPPSLSHSLPPLSLPPLSPLSLSSGLLGAHFAADAIKSQGHPLLQWYDGQLVGMAKTVGDKLLPAFNTSTGIPYSRVRHTVYILLE